MQDTKSRDLWIEDYLPLVKSIVSRMRHHFPESYETEDMYGIGARALVVAVNKFDSSKGKAFGNYATLRIKGALLDANALDAVSAAKVSEINNDNAK